MTKLVNNSVTGCGRQSAETCLEELLLGGLLGQGSSRCRLLHRGSCSRLLCRSRLVCRSRLGCCGRRLAQRLEWQCRLVILVICIAKILSFPATQSTLDEMKRTCRGDGPGPTCCVASPSITVALNTQIRPMHGPYPCPAQHDLLCSQIQ